jgi:hypothetical protein
MPEMIDEFGEIHQMSLIEKNGKFRSRYISIFILESNGLKHVHMAIEGEDGKQPEAQLVNGVSDNDIIDLTWIGTTLQKHVNISPDLI